MVSPDDDALDRLAPREAARQRARERKRTVRMVVDGAGIRRLLLDAARRRTPETDRPDEPARRSAR